MINFHICFHSNVNQGVEAVDNIVHGQAETTAFDSTAANELGVVQSKPYFAVDQLMAEINGETADPEPDAVESEATEPAVEAAEVAEAAELVEVSLIIFAYFTDFCRLNLKRQQNGK